MTNISRATFARDTHGKKYIKQIDTEPDASNLLFALLNDPLNEQNLMEAEGDMRPALDGIVEAIEATPEILDILQRGRQGHRFRQTVGVAVKLKMCLLGWRKNATSKGNVTNSNIFTRSQRYIRNP